MQTLAVELGSHQRTALLARDRPNQQYELTEVLEVILTRIELSQVEELAEDMFDVDNIDLAKVAINIAAQSSGENEE